MNLAKIQLAMSLSNKKTWEEFVEDVLDFYIQNRIEENQEDEESILADVLETQYVMKWGSQKEKAAQGVSADSREIRILAGSDFAVDETDAINGRYSVIRERLIEQGIIDTSDPNNYKFATDYTFPSFSTAGSVIRGYNVNGLQNFKTI